MKHIKRDTITVSVMLVFALILGLIVLHEFILAVILGVMLKVIIEPIYLYLKRQKLGPKLAASLLIVVIVLIVVGPVSYVATTAINQGRELATNLTQNQDLTLSDVIAKLYNWEPIHMVSGSPKELEAEIVEGLDKFKNVAAPFLLKKIGTLPGFVLQSFVVLMVCFFLLVDGQGLKNFFKDKIPLDPTLQKKIGDNLEKTTVSSFWATFTAASTQSFVMGLAYLVLGMPAVVLAAGVTFISAWIPLLGSAPVWIAGSIYLLVKKYYAKLIIMIAIGLFTSVIDNVVRSIVLKGRDNMHPGIGLLAIFGGISLFGIAGVFVGPVIATLIITLMDMWSYLFKKS